VACTSLSRLRVKHQKLVCLDAGHYHPTENMADKISSVLCFVPEILLHVSRGVRWDSDHVVTLTDELHAIARNSCAAVTSPDAHRTGFLRRQHQSHRSLDHWRKKHAPALCMAMLEPHAQYKNSNWRRLQSRLALMKRPRRCRSAPCGISTALRKACRREAWLAEVKAYERTVLATVRSRDSSERGTQMTKPKRRPPSRIPV